MVKRFREFVIITSHICNKNCKWCGIRIHESDFGYVSMEDFKYMIECISPNQRAKMQRMVLSGGEPLIHPHYEEMVRLLREAMPHIQVLTSTNGLLLDKFAHLRSKHVVFKISVYPGWNDKIVQKYKGATGIKLERYKKFINAKSDIDFDDSKTQILYDTCKRKRIMVVGRKVYPCCTAEVTERCHNLEKPVHVPLTPNWKQDILDLDFKHACKYCWRFAADLDKGIWDKGHD